MKYIKLIILFIFTLILSCKTNDTTLIPAELLLEDYDQLVSSYQHYHPKTFTNEVKFREITVSTRNRITDMTEYDFFKLIAPTIGVINCGHTFMNYSDKQYTEIYNSPSFLPLDVVVIEDEIYVLEDLSNSGIEKKSRIHTINDRSSSEILNLIYESMPSDGENLSYKNAALNLPFGSDRSFENAYYFYIESPDSFIIEYSLDGSNELLVANIPPGPANINSSWYSEELKYDFKDNYGALRIQNFNTYGSSELEKFKESIDNFFTELTSRNIDNLIIDIRGNSGGDPYSSNFLLSYILQEPFTYFSADTPYYEDLKELTEINKNSFKGSIYIIVDGHLFSTGGHFLSHIADKNVGAIVGTESGASFSCNDGSKEVRLNNSGITINMPRINFSTSVKSLQLGKGIQPDITISYKIDDYLAGRDLEMEKVLELIEE